MKKLGPNMVAILFIWLMILLAMIAMLLTSCHPYPYKSIKPDKAKHATFR